MLGPQSQVGLWEQSPRVPAPRVKGLVLGSSLPLHPYPCGLCASPETRRREMAVLMRGKDSSRCLLLLAAVLMVESSQFGSSRAKLNSIKSSLGGETPAQAANRSAGTYQGLAFGGSKKGKNLGQVGKYPKYIPARRDRGWLALALPLPLRPSTFLVCPQVWRARQLGRGSQKQVCMGEGGWVATCV